MRPYPKLSEEAYADPAIHHAEVMAEIADMAAEMWRYYGGSTLNEQDLQRLSQGVQSGLPTYEQDVARKAKRREELNGTASVSRARILLSPEALRHYVRNVVIRP